MKKRMKTVDNDDDDDGDRCQRETGQHARSWGQPASCWVAAMFAGHGVRAGGSTGGISAFKGRRLIINLINSCGSPWTPG